MKILVVGIALFHAGGRIDERTDMTRLIAFTTALQMCLKEAYAIQHRYIRPRLHWTTQQSGQTPDMEVDISHITVYVSGYTETDPTGILSPNNGRLSGAKKVGLFRADSLARYLLQCA